MGAGSGTHGSGGGKKDNPFRDLAGTLAAVKDGYKLAAEAAARAFKSADGADPHPVAAETAVACAHMEAAARYVAAARLLARGIDLSSCGYLHKTYLRRIVALVGRSVALSAKSSKIMGRLPDLEVDENEAVDRMRRAKRLAAEGAERARATYDAMRAEMRGTDRDSDGE